MSALWKETLCKSLLNLVIVEPAMFKWSFSLSMRLLFSKLSFYDGPLLFTISVYEIGNRLTGVVKCHELLVPKCQCFTFLISMLNLGLFLYLFCSLSCIGQHDIHLILILLIRAAIAVRVSLFLNLLQSLHH